VSPRHFIWVLAVLVAPMAVMPARAGDLNFTTEFDGVDRLDSF
jgi:hypothetical protein